MKNFQKRFDVFLERYGTLIVSIALAIIFVLLARPLPLDVLWELSLWWFIAPVLLFLLVAYLIYRKLEKEKPEEKDKFVVSGE